jgi:hypothetical protein
VADQVLVGDQRAGPVAEQATVRVFDNPRRQDHIIAWRSRAGSNDDVDIGQMIEVFTGHLSDQFDSLELTGRVESRDDHFRDGLLVHEDDASLVGSCRVPCPRTLLLPAKTNSMPIRRSRDVWAWHRAHQTLAARRAAGYADDWWKSDLGTI